MKWDFQRSKDRLARERVRIQDAGLNIQRLSREMNLTNLSPTDARIVQDGGSRACFHRKIGGVNGRVRSRDENRAIGFGGKFGQAGKHNDNNVHQGTLVDAPGWVKGVASKLDSLLHAAPAVRNL